MDDQKTLDLAKVFGAPVVINSNLRDGSLRACCVEKGMPMLIYEAGEALRFDEISIRAGIRGVMNVMRYIGMLPMTKSTKLSSPLLARNTKWVRSPTSGIVSGKAKLGSSVVKGQRMASISDPLGTAEYTANAPFDGIVIGRSNLPLAYEGEALFNVAAFKSVTQAENVVEEFSAEHDPEAQDE
jgi:predicted deacylase